MIQRFLNRPGIFSQAEFMDRVKINPLSADNSHIKGLSFHP